MPLGAMASRQYPFAPLCALARCSKETLPRLSEENAKLVKKYLTPTECPCKTTIIKARPAHFFCMTSSELQEWAEQNKRPDMLLHVPCVEEREKLDKCSDDLERLLKFPRGVEVDVVIRAKTVNFYLQTGCWENRYEFPTDGIFAEVARLMAAWKA